MKWHHPKIQLILPILAGCVLAGGVWLYLKQVQRRIESHFTMVTVLKTNRYIRSGKIIKEKMIEEVSIPQAFVQPTAYLSKSQFLEETKHIKPRARIELLKGEQITRSKVLTQDKITSLSYALAVGRQALTLRLTKENAVGGLIHPGDWVDLICTMDIQPGWKHPQAFSVVKNVQILAVDEHIWDPTRPRSKINNKDVAKEEFWVTFSVDPNEAVLIRLASQKGVVSAVLNSPFETEKHPPVRAHMTELSG
jgi:Flp pilus assembly protein CpaB